MRTFTTQEGLLDMTEEVFSIYQEKFKINHPTYTEEEIESLIERVAELADRNVFAFLQRNNYYEYKFRILEAEVDNFGETPVYKEGGEYHKIQNWINKHDGGLYEGGPYTLVIFPNDPTYFYGKLISKNARLVYPNKPLKGKQLLERELGDCYKIYSPISDFAVYLFKEELNKL